MYKKHVDVVSTQEEFRQNYEEGVYQYPFVVYVGDDTTGYDIVYGSEEMQSASNFNFQESIMKRIVNLETEKVYCYEDEYENLVSNGSGWITNLDGSKTEVTYDSSKTYCIYEDEGPNA